MNAPTKTPKTTAGRAATGSHRRARVSGGPRCAAVSGVAREVRVRSAVDGGAGGHARHHSVLTRLRRAVQGGRDLRELRHQHAD